MDIKECNKNVWIKNDGFPRHYSTDVPLSSDRNFFKSSFNIWMPLQRIGIIEFDSLVKLLCMVVYIEVAENHLISITKFLSAHIYIKPKMSGTPYNNFVFD